jgi:DNA polymerase
VSDPGEIRKALASWVGYLGEIGVRELGMRPGTVASPSPSPSPAPASEPAAAEAAPGRETLDAIRADLGDCRRCKLCGTRKNIVFGVGDPHARLMIVGEGPGADEDEQGEPFVGRAGQKLNEMIKAIGLERQDVFIANIVKCRPPGNRDPEPDEVATCSPFLFRQIEAIAPKAIVALGSPAAKTLLGTKEGITKIRGTWGSFRGIPVMPTFHPAYLLRAYTVENRRLVFEDLKAARRRIDEAS